MTLVQASFEVSPSGTAIPKSGGADAFTTAYNGSGTSFVSDSTVPAAVAAGSFAAKITIGSTYAQTYRGWTWSGGVVHTRQYVYLTASPNSRFTWWENYKPSSYVSRIRINTDRTVGIGTPDQTWFTTGAIPLDTLCRIEASFDHAAGTMSLDIYLGNSLTPITGGSVSVTGITFTSTTITQVNGGPQSTLTNFTMRTDAWAVSDTARVGPIVLGGTIDGVTAVATAQANAGTVGAVVGGTVTIAGVTANVVVQGGERAVPPAPTFRGVLWPPDPYREVIRTGGYSLVYSAAASLGGVPVTGATDLRPTGGTITDTTKPGVRRVLNMELAPEPGLFDLLAPVGTRLTLTAQITYLNRAVQPIPMGVFEVDAQKLSEGGGGLTLTALDKWAAIQRARFIGPAASTPGILVVDQIAQLIQGALGSSETVAVSATSTATVGALTWEKDRDKAILKLAEDIGAWVYFDRDGLATIADAPAVGTSADWLVDASASGVLVELDRERSRTDAYNVVMVESSAAEGAVFATQVVWDNDPGSPTFAGVNPVTDPGSAGPFGIVVHYYDTPLPLSDFAARQTALTILSRGLGLSSRVSLGQLQNPALNASDVLDVLPPRERFDLPRVLERHIADSVTHPLVGGAQQVEGRSISTQASGGGS